MQITLQVAVTLVALSSERESTGRAMSIANNGRLVLLIVHFSRNSRYMVAMKLAAAKAVRAQGRLAKSPASNRSSHLQLAGGNLLALHSSGLIVTHLS
jgi:hypothetical protein